MNEDLEIGIELPEGGGPFTLDETITGQIVIRSEKDMVIDYLRCRLLYESRGLMRIYTTEIGEVLLLEGLSFKENQRYVYPIEVKNKDYETYKGENIELLVKLDVSIKPQNTEVSSEILSKIAHWGKSGIISKSKYIDFFTKEENFEITSRKVNLELDSLDTLLFVSLLIVFIIGFLIANTEFYESYKTLIIVLGFGLLIMNLLYSYFAKYIIGKIEVEFNDKENNEFELKLSNSHNFKQVKRLEVSYQIHEEVIDNRGTSESKETAIIYKSMVKTWNIDKHERSLSFDYPKGKPQSLRYKDARIYWMIELRLFSLLELQFSCQGEFEVKKKCP